MGNGMDKVLPGLYVGNYRDSKDPQQLEKYNITHIVAIHDSPRRLIPDKHYLCIMASDTPDQNISQYFSVCNDFIHAARLRDGNVLIHCLAGMSRSVTVAVAYIMSVTPLSWREALKVVRSGRSVANPNSGFQDQLQDFEAYKLNEERRRLKERFPTLVMELSDKDECRVALSSYAQLLSNNDICEGNCVRGQSCPTGLCNSDTRPGIFRKKSNTRSRLSISNMNQSKKSSSCPSSPRQGLRMNHSCASLNQIDTQLASTSSSALHRSASTMSAIRPRSSPSGLFSYTGSAPPSVHGSRVDLSSFDKGSAIYLGCSPPRQNSFSASTAPTVPNTGAISKTSTSNNRGSTHSISARSTKSPMNTPPASPKKQPNSTKTRLKSTNNSTINASNATAKSISNANTNVHSSSHSNLNTIKTTDSKMNSKNSKNTANTMTASTTTPSTSRSSAVITPKSTTSKSTTADKTKKPPMPTSAAKSDKKS